MPQETTPIPPTREEISNAMNLAGGSFIRALAPSLLYADETNYAKLEAAFPEEFRNYTQMAIAFRDRLKETAPDLADPFPRCAVT